MRRAIFPLLLVVIVLQSFQRADACGDKFLLVGRGVKFQHAYAAIYPAKIVIVTSHGGRSSAIQDPKFQTALERAGHHVAVASDTTRLEQMLKPGDVDLVLGNWADLAGLKAPAIVAQTTVLPILDKPTKVDSQSCGQQYNNCQLRSSDKLEEFLTVIDSTMKSKVKSQKDQKKH